jgi:hypothetical protein
MLHLTASWAFRLQTTQPRPQNKLMQHDTASSRCPRHKTRQRSCESACITSLHTAKQFEWRWTTDLGDLFSLKRSCSQYTNTCKSLGYDAGPTQTCSVETITLVSFLQHYRACSKTISKVQPVGTLDKRIMNNILGLSIFCYCAEHGPFSHVPIPMSYSHTIESTYRCREWRVVDARYVAHVQEFFLSSNLFFSPWSWSCFSRSSSYAPVMTLFFCSRSLVWHHDLRYNAPNSTSKKYTCIALSHQYLPLKHTT